MKWKINDSKDVNVNVAPYVINWATKAPSAGAQQVKDFIKKHCKTNIWLEEFRIPKTLLRADFVNLTLKFVIEFNGRQHSEYVKHFHRSRLGYVNSIKRDIKKVEAWERNGFIVVEVEDEDLPLTKEWFSDNYNVWL